MTYDDIRMVVGRTGLEIVGGFHPEADPDLPSCRTLLMLGPAGPGMWAAFQRAPEAVDDLPDPLDRWSARVIGALATELGALAVFPFGGPPYRPFIRWAGRAEGATASPVAMMVTRARGLWTSYRGALAFETKLDLPDRDTTPPCTACDRPCTTACPVNALGPSGYDVARCVAHLKTAAGTACLSGCLARQSCPAGAAIDLPQEQRRFHMQAFLRSNG